MYLKEIIAVIAFASGTPAVSQDASKEGLRIVTFGAGPIDGAYYESVTAICDKFNQDPLEDHRCSTDPTPGSRYNLDALKRGTLDFAFVQSDLQRLALQNERGPNAAVDPSALRSVLALYPEPFTILVRNDADIRTLADLRGKHVDRGPSSSGRRPTVERVFSAVGLDEPDFAELTQHVPQVALEELCTDRLDAVLLVIGHPNTAVARTLDACDVRLTDASGPHLDTFVAQNPDFAPGLIPRDTYLEQDEDVVTFSVIATVVTRRDTPAALVARMAGTIIDELSTLRQAGVPAGQMTGDERWTTGLTAPLHPAMERVFHERGLDPTEPTER